MTREEERIKQIEQFASQCYEDGERYSAFISGAIWADNNNAQDVVNLNDLWHDAIEEPQGEYDIVCQDTLENVWLTNRREDMKYHQTGWEECVMSECIVRWAYVKDILPKGGKK